MSRLRLLNGSLEAVQQQVENLEVRTAETSSAFCCGKVAQMCLKSEAFLCVRVLQNLQEEMDKQESSLRKFGSVTHQLLTECHPSVADTLNRALQDVNIR